MPRNNGGRKFVSKFAEKAWRVGQVMTTGLDPIGEAECHERVAAQKLLDLNRAAEEAMRREREAEAAAAEQVAAPAAAAAVDVGAPADQPGEV